MALLPNELLPSSLCMHWTLSRVISHVVELDGGGAHTAAELALD